MIRTPPSSAIWRSSTARPRKLFEAGAEVAAVARRRARADAQRALAAYGRHLGTAYQLVDDVLDYRSEPVSAARTSATTWPRASRRCR